MPGKKLFVLLILVLMIGTIGCEGRQIDPPDKANDAWKIGIITSPVAPNEEAYRMAEGMQQRYGANRILHTTYPDQFMQEQETTITNMLEMASDPDIKAIIMVQAVPGALAAVNKIREARSDILIILGFPQDDPDIIAQKADIILDTNDILYGDRIAEKAHALGAEVFVHYSFPRHLSTKVLAERKQMIKDKAEELGLIFLNEDVPDPTVGPGAPETRQFISEDVPRKIDQYGPNTAFLVTNCVMLEPLICQVIDCGGITLIQHYRSPYDAVPEALGIEVPDDKKDDMQWMMDQIQARVAEEGTTGRVASWPVPVDMLFIEAGIEYAIEWINGNTNGRVDKEIMIDIMKSITGSPVILTEYSGIDNYFLYGSEDVVISTRP